MSGGTGGTDLTETIAIADLSDAASKTGTGSVVVMQGSPTITTPTIADLTNAQHNHSNAAGGGALSSAVDVAQCQLEFVSASELDLHPFDGDKIMIAGVLETVGVSIVSGTTLISASGANLGTTMVANTLYHIYLAGSSASYAPGTAHPSVTAPTTDAAGVDMLATSGDGANWRHVGWVYMAAGPIFADSDTWRGVKSRYNRVPKRAYLCPGYNDNNAGTNISVNQTPLAPHPSVASPHVTFITDGAESVTFFAVAVCGSGEATSLTIGIGLDSVTNIGRGAYLPISSNQTVSVSETFTPTAGAHYVNLMLRTSGAKSVTADLARNGAVADPPATYIEGVIWC